MIYSDRRPGFGIGPDLLDHHRRPDLFVDILPRRVIAFAIDAVIILVIMIPVLLAVFVLGILTLGLGWLLFPFLFAIVALGYLAFTLGGEGSATIGMRAAGVELRTIGGRRMYPLLAVLHGLLFWFSVSLLTPLVLIVGLLNDRRRLLHDMLLGVVVVNSAAVDRLEHGVV